jgi:hypothetical protein
MLIIGQSESLEGEEPEAGDVRPVRELCRSVLQGIASEFERCGCVTHEWNGERLAGIPEHFVMLNPVLLGELPASAQLALGREDIDRFRSELRASLPEVYPHAIRVGRRLDLHHAIHPSVIDLVLVDDTSGAIEALSSERKVILIRMLMAKLGASKNVIVPYRRTDDGEVRCDRLILGTMEGGHPMLDVQETARRLMILGSTKAVGGWTKSADYQIAADDWARSPVVGGLLHLSQFLGKHELLSRPVMIRELVNESKLADTLIGLLNYSRQAEGAFWAIDHDLPYSDRRLRWPARGVFPLVTVSGRYGAVKTELGPDDIVAVIPVGSGGVEVVPTGDREPRGPSVEAEEFTLPLLDMPMLAVGRADGRSTLVPPIRAGIHMHRGFVPPSSERVFVIPTDIEAFPPVGCGVDLMHEMSRDAMRRAVHLWEERGRAPVGAVFYVPNHGTNVFLFWTADTRGAIPSDPFELFREVVETGELTFLPDVPQF